VTAGAYPRKRVEDALIKAKLPASYRIIPRQHLDTPLGVEPADSRFCAKADGYAILYATPDFAAAFIEVIVRDRFARKKHRELLLKEVTDFERGYRTGLGSDRHEAKGEARPARFA
jgi:hypothetical protein